MNSPRAVTAEGVAWVWERPDYVGVDPGPVYVAENRDERWGEDWTPAEWANQVTPSGGVVSFSGDDRNRLGALGAGGVLLALVVLGIIGQQRRPS